MAYNNGWGFEAITKHNKNFRTFTVGYGNKNPNDNTYQKTKSKKKK